MLKTAQLIAKHWLNAMGSHAQTHRPGVRDIKYDKTLNILMARPNFHYLMACGRPCRLPLFPFAQLGGKETDVCDDFPCEARYPHDRQAGPYCYSAAPQDSDWLTVIGWTVGQIITNEIGQNTDIWYAISIPLDKVKRHKDQLVFNDAHGGYIVYASRLCLAILVYMDCHELTLWWANYCLDDYTNRRGFLFTAQSVGRPPA